MFDKPKRTLDDTNPPQAFSLDDHLRATEPPRKTGDTNPNRRTDAHQWLSANEPPILEGDTHPSIAARQQILSDDWPPERGSGRWLRAVAALLVVSAFILVALAAYIWTDVNETDASETPEDGIIAEGIPNQDDTTATPSPTPQAPVADSVVTNGVPAYTGLQMLYPTAAADEIAAALQTPAAVEPPSGAVTVKSAPFTIQRGTGRSKVVQYVVQEGDSLESIAEDFGLSDFYTLIWSNKSSKYNPLRPGVELNILPTDGVYYEVTEHMTIAELAAEYNVDPYTIIDAEYNNLFGSTPDTLLIQGMFVVIPGAEAERALYLPQSASTSSGGSAGSISGTYSLWGCTANVQGGTLPYGRPLANYTWMRGFTPGGHTGVDIAANSGDPIYASGGGTVVYAGWSSGGYGNVVVLAHGSVFTLYAHMTSTGVSCGQQVSAGSVIGSVGSTGNSSGPHLHFEVRDANFTALDPQNWVGF